MDYYQNVVLDYLRADRAVFVNPECCIQLDDLPNPLPKRHWYCDATAVDFRDTTVFLCEVSFASGLGSLIRRLKAWGTLWPEVKKAVFRDCKVPDTWTVRPWLFIPGDFIRNIEPKLRGIKGATGQMAFRPRITDLESVQPWKYNGWNHQDCQTKKSKDIPDDMRN